MHILWKTAQYSGYETLRVRNIEWNQPHRHRLLFWYSIFGFMHGNVCTMYIGQMCDNNIIQMTMFTHIHCCALVKTTDDWRRFSSTIWPFFYYNRWSSWFCCTFCHAVTWSQILTEYTGLWSIPCFCLSFALSFQTKLFVSFARRNSVIYKFKLHVALMWQKHT